MMSLECREKVVRQCNATESARFVDVLVDSGSEVTACGLGFAKEFGMTAAESPKVVSGIEGGQVPQVGERVVSMSLRDTDRKPVKASM